jgi:hypothetical protein
VPHTADSGRIDGDGMEIGEEREEMDGDEQIHDGGDGPEHPSTEERNGTISNDHERLHGHNAGHADTRVRPTSPQDSLYRHDSAPGNGENLQGIQGVGVSGPPKKKIRSTGNPTGKRKGRSRTGGKHV